MRVFRLYLFDILAFVVSYAAAFGAVLTAVLVFGALTGMRHFDQWLYDAIIVAMMWNLGRLYEHYRMGGFG